MRSRAPSAPKCDMSLWPKLYGFDPTAIQKDGFSEPSAMVRWLIAHGAEADARADYAYDLNGPNMMQTNGGRAILRRMRNARPLTVLCRSWASLTSVPGGCSQSLGRVVEDATHALVVEGKGTTTGDEFEVTRRDRAMYAAGHEVTGPPMSLLDIACKNGMPTGVVETLLRHGAADSVDIAVALSQPIGSNVLRWSSARYVVELIRCKEAEKVDDSSLVVLALLIGHGDDALAS
mmetsp:Transcript_57966/g.160175  ORF Transcript_57966/g.160175 Transcript_57966/m.160175 type:complete len:234 (-) Transcript_57966:1172-1873(-)